jgi:hypothetical protein
MPGDPFMNKLAAFVVLLAVSSPAVAWNDKGHMVTARLAWQKLSEEQRASVLAILRKHPHYEEFLAAKRPEGFSEDEWVFMRAATWADWVRSHHKNEYHHGTWHYIDYPFVPPGSQVDAGKHQPPADAENAVNQLAVCAKQIRTGSSEDAAIYLCWLFHLIGDIHQPLHCTSMFSEQFPQGDRGGNLAIIRIRTSPMKLHPMWDGLLGRDLKASAIDKDVREITKLLTDDPASIS